MQEGLISADYNIAQRVGLFLYRDGSTYDIRNILAYSSYVSQYQCRRVLVFNGDKRTHDMRLSHTGGWFEVHGANGPTLHRATEGA